MTPDAIGFPQIIQFETHCYSGTGSRGLSPPLLILPYATNHTTRKTKSWAEFQSNFN